MSLYEPPNSNLLSEYRRESKLVHSRWAFKRKENKLWITRQQTENREWWWLEDTESETPWNGQLLTEDENQKMWFCTKKGQVMLLNGNLQEHWQCQVFRVYGTSVCLATDLSTCNSSIVKTDLLKNRQSLRKLYYCGLHCHKKSWLSGGVDLPQHSNCNWRWAIRGKVWVQRRGCSL